MAEESEERRRLQLREFLSQSRSRLRPSDVGLPETGRRRVIGLRREEVAELAGVSCDWYRWFESGRSIRVSPQFLSRLGQALRMDNADRRMLYHLAVPELYETDAADVLCLARFSHVTPLQSSGEVADVLQKVSKARDMFLSHDPAALNMVRPRIWKSWERSMNLGANPARTEVPCAAETNSALEERRYASRLLLEAAAPTLESLNRMLENSGYVIVLTDAQGCILQMSGPPEVLRALARIHFEAGGDLRESAVGTNAVGTALADERALQVIGAENFCEGGSDLTCAAAPIRDAATHEVLGVLDVTGSYRLIHPQMIATVAAAALEIEESLATALVQMSALRA